ncbi:MAG: hypothetical protein KDB86_09460 [Actinobacteria bacterium]|nr:hypothetical protein [Actinomycetota bacterium]MCB9390734.1 hypothetical protein [Acidimicrobiia bacterium]
MPYSLCNQTTVSELSNDDITRALARIAMWDPCIALDAEHVVAELLTEDIRPNLSQSVLQDWLWERLPNAFVSNAIHLANAHAWAAGALFDELGLARYAAICVSEQTAQVFEAWGRSTRSGTAAYNRAADRSGVRPRDLIDFRWSVLPFGQEAAAYRAVGQALERAISEFRLRPGARGWRRIQANITSNVLDSDHPTMPGQSWRTAVLTEKVASWLAAADERAPRLARARASIANRLLHWPAAPSDAAEVVGALQSFLLDWGDERPVANTFGVCGDASATGGEAGSSRLARYRESQDGPPDVFDEAAVSDVVQWMQKAGALKRYKQSLRCTPRGRNMLVGPNYAWRVLAENLGGSGWAGFVAETAILYLAVEGRAVPVSEVESFVQAAAAEMGWQAVRAGGQPPTMKMVQNCLAEVAPIWSIVGFVDDDTASGRRTFSLTYHGHALAVAFLHYRAVDGSRG